MRRSSVHSLSYIAIFLLIISVIIYLNLIFQENLKIDITRQFNRQQLLLARGASLSIEKQVDHYVKHLVTLSQIPSIGTVKDDPARHQILKTVLDDIPPDDATIVNFQIINGSGRLSYDRFHPGLVGMNMS
ncbi:MAG: hypothetical protein ABSG42_08620, partial [Nitrospirota bacterium]